MSPIERYLAQSSDLVELERRQRQLQLKGFKLWDHSWLVSSNHLKRIG